MRSSPLGMGTSTGGAGAFTGCAVTALGGDALGPPLAAGGLLPSPCLPSLCACADAERAKRPAAASRRLQTSEYMFLDVTRHQGPRQRTLGRRNVAKTAQNRGSDAKF